MALKRTENTTNRRNNQQVTMGVATATIGCTYSVVRQLQARPPRQGVSPGTGGGSVVCVCVCVCVDMGMCVCFCYVMFGGDVS